MMDLKKQQNIFRNKACFPANEKWEASCSRLFPLDRKEDDIRSDFKRDELRILHSAAYSRLKSKTQVFFRTHNDQICTRIEHVNHVTSVSTTLAEFLGLNTELCRAISMGHDLGHAPFGHSGEFILQRLSAEAGIGRFWHEQNSLYAVDNLEILQDPEGFYRNLDLTYGVRDGIVSHCGEVDENGIFPRQEAMDLEQIERPNQYAPYTWEACVVKISDKISYLGRDIDDAIKLNILSTSQLLDWQSILGTHSVPLNNTNLIHGFIMDLCRHSHPERGIYLSDEALNLMIKIKKFNYEYIYKHPRLKNYEEYAALVLKSLFKTLAEVFEAENMMQEIQNRKKIYPKLSESFGNFLAVYSIQGRESSSQVKYKNKALYDLTNKKDYMKAIVEYISGLTDRYAISLFEELTFF